MFISLKDILKIGRQISIPDALSSVIHVQASSMRPFLTAFSKAVVTSVFLYPLMVCVVNLGVLFIIAV